MKGFFVTGTDTGVGKTRISVALIQQLQQRGLRVAGFKPVASGAHRTEHGLRNDDALALQAQANLALEYQDINPYCFEPPIAPHLAARQAGHRIDVAELVTRAEKLNRMADAVVVEGAGGWRVPLNEHDDIATLAQRLALPVILVVAIRLGCLNHALLTARDITACGVPFAGWIANFADTQDDVALQNIATLRERLAAPCLGVVPCLAVAENAEAFIESLPF